MPTLKNRCTTTVEKKWESIRPFSRGLFGTTRLLLTRSAGDAKIVDVLSGGKGLKTVWSGKQPPNGTWVIVRTFFVDFTPHALYYDHANGKIAFARLSDIDTGSSPQVTYSDAAAIGKQWTEFLPFISGNDTYLFAYSAMNGTSELLKVKAQAKGATPVSGSNSPGLGTGWSSWASIDVKQGPHVLAYNIGNGAVRIDKLKATGTGIANQSTFEWPDVYGLLVGSYVGKKPCVVRWANQATASASVVAGDVSIEQLKASLNGTTTVLTKNWGTQLSVLASFNMGIKFTSPTSASFNFEHYVLRYEAGNGKLWIDEILP